MVWVRFKPTTLMVESRPADHYTRLTALLELGKVVVSFSVYK